MYNKQTCTKIENRTNKSILSLSVFTFVFSEDTIITDTLRTSVWPLNFSKISGKSLKGYNDKVYFFNINFFLNRVNY